MSAPIANNSPLQPAAVSPVDSQEVLGSVDASGTTLLPDPTGLPAFSGDIGAEIAALCVQSGTQEQRTDQAERDALETQQEGQEDKEVQAMRDKASTILAEGIVEGVGAMLEGGATVAGSLASSGDQVGAGGKKTYGTFLAMNSVEWNASGTAVGGLGKMVGAVYQQAGANDDADAAQARAAAGRLSTAAQDIHDDTRDASQLVQSALEFLKEYEQTQAQTRNAALHAV